MATVSDLHTPETFE